MDELRFTHDIDSISTTTFLCLNLYKDDNHALIQKYEDVLRCGIRVCESFLMCYFNKYRLIKIMPLSILLYLPSLHLLLSISVSPFSALPFTLAHLIITTLPTRSRASVQFSISSFKVYMINSIII